MQHALPLPTHEPPGRRTLGMLAAWRPLRNQPEATEERASARHGRRPEHTMATPLLHTGARQFAPILTHSAALALHVGAAALGSAALGLAFALSLLYLLGEKQIKNKHPGRLFSRLPSLDLIDRAGWRLSVWGFVFLSIAIATGSLVSKESTGASFPLQPKEGFAVLAWALLAALIQARLVAGWRGRRVALLVVAGFLLLVGTYAGLFAAPPQASTLSMLVPGGG